MIVQQVEAKSFCASLIQCPEAPWITQVESAHDYFFSYDRAGVGTLWEVEGKGEGEEEGNGFYYCGYAQHIHTPKFDSLDRCSF